MPRAQGLEFFLRFAPPLLLLALGLYHAQHYSLWDDEANTALLAQHVRATGDTVAEWGDRVIAYRNGAELETGADGKLRARYVSPLQYYVEALAVPHPDASTPIDPFVARLPFILFWALTTFWIFWRAPRSTLVWLALLLFLTPTWTLFGVQARYYSLTLFFAACSLEVALFRPTLDERPRAFWGLLGLSTALLFVSNYLTGLAWMGLLAWALLRTHKLKPFSQSKTLLQSLLAFSTPHLIFSLPVFLIWNPLGKSVVQEKNSLTQKLKLFFWNWRDLNGTQMGVLALMIGLGLWLQAKKSPLNRFGLYLSAVALYLAVIASFSPQPVGGTNVADVRYLYPLMLITIVWSLDVILALQKKMKTGLVLILVLILNGTLILQRGQFQVPTIDWLQEQFSPAQDPYRAAAQLVREQLQDNTALITRHDQKPTLAVSLDYALYPLLTQLPEFVMVDQRTSEWTAGPLAPHYVLTFCNPGHVDRFGGLAVYKKVAQTKSVCREAFRPELFWRSFGKNEVLGEIELFERIEP
jgi:hypothetical protein